MPFGNDSPFPLSDAFIGRTGARGYMADLLKARASRSRSFEAYDFNIKALDTTNVWTTACGATTTDWAVLAAAGGWVRGVTGTTTATAGLQLYQPQKYWTGTSTGGVAFLWKSNVVQGVTIEMGFANALPSINTTVINNATTPTFNTSVDVAMYLYQHDGNATAAPTRVGLYTNNSSSGTAQKSLATISTLGDKPGPAAATEHFVAIELQGTNVLLWQGDLSAPLVLTDGVTAANGMIPFFAVKGNNSTSKSVDIDAMFTWSGRLG